VREWMICGGATREYYIWGRSLGRSRPNRWDRTGRHVAVLIYPIRLDSKLGLIFHRHKFQGQKYEKTAWIRYSLQLGMYLDLKTRLQYFIKVYIRPRESLVVLGLVGQ